MYSLSFLIFKSNFHQLGKSNVIDSLLFVIGHRASKMRGAKLSTLLHNSAECPNVKSCSVTVHFEAIAIENPTEKIRFSITRVAFPDNSSHYKINEKQVSLKDVTKLLREYGVDLDHSRYLILQGDVESIAMMKPIAANEHEQGFLEYLEDIIGTERFKKPLDLLNLKVEELSAMWAEKVIEHFLFRHKKNSEILEKSRQSCTE